MFLYHKLVRTVKKKISSFFKKVSITKKTVTLKKYLGIAVGKLGVLIFLCDKIGDGQEDSET